MDTFIHKFAEKITASLEGFDRVIFKGHLRAISFPVPRAGVFRDTELG